MSPGRTGRIWRNSCWTRDTASSDSFAEAPPRRTSVSRISSIAWNSSPADLLDQTSLTDVVHDCQPDEIYNLAAQSFVQTSWTQPVLTGEFTALGVTRMLEAMKKSAPKARFYQASSSEMFGKVVETPQRESTPFYPRSPYGVAKVYAHWITVNYRESFGLYAVSGILFNHESPRRGLEFVTRKVTDAAAAHQARVGDKRSPPGQPGITAGLGLRRRLRGRDVAHAAAVGWPDDYVITARGHTFSVRELCATAFGCVGLDYREYVKQDAKVHSARPKSTSSSPIRLKRAAQQLGWEPAGSRSRRSSK